jgi:class 3 adenylate cyclase/tetratricopeptide (TPR) repeat protein
VPFCIQCGRENLVAAKFCVACGAAMPASSARVPEQERRTVTAVFTDVIGSTSRAERLDPEDVGVMLRSYYASARQEFERFGGMIDKFLGDGLVALFGAPLAHEDDPERAVRAALAIREALGRINADDEWLDLHIRVGVNTGETLITLGDDGREEGMAQGDLMNTAARLQSAAPVDGILVDEVTYNATRQVIEYRDARSIDAKGKSEPVRVWEAVAVKETVAARPASRHRLVGRRAERDRLLELWTEVRSQQRRALATVLGAPGIGKSRLLADVAGLAQADGAVLTARCLPYGEGITYFPIAWIVRSAAGILTSDDAATTSAKLGRFLDSLGGEPDELRSIAATLANLMGVPATRNETSAGAEITQAELHWGIRRLLELLASKRPLLVILEDLHWAEPTLLELILLIAKGGADAPLFVLVSSRPELAESHPTFIAASGYRNVLELEALDERESQELLAELVGAESAAPEGALAALLQNAAGNPLFLEETVRMVMDEDLLGTSDDELAALPVPTSLRALIASRLDRLPENAKRIVQYASVAGSVFWTGAVTRMNGVEADLLEGLQTLERRDLVHERVPSTVVGEREYGFKHGLIRDVAYDRLPKGRRAQLHLRFTEWLKELHAAGDEVVEILAWHLEQACHLAREVARSPIQPPISEAVEALRRAGDKAKRREGNREADRFYARALELAGEDDAEDTIELRLRRAGTRLALGELRQAREQLLDIAEQALAAGRRDTRCEALVALADVDQNLGRAAESNSCLKEAEEIALEIGDRRLQVQVGYKLAHQHEWFDGEYDASVDDLRRALAIAEEIDDPFLTIIGHFRLGTLFINGGELSEAEDHLLRALALAREMGSQRFEARATALLGYVRYYRGELEEAEQLALQAHARLERTGDRDLQLQNLRELAKYALAGGDPKLAEDRLLEALPLALESGGWIVIQLYRYLTEALVEQGRLGEAHKLVAFAARNVPDEDVSARTALLQAEAIVAVAEGEQSTATASFQEVLRLLEGQQWLIDLGEARLAFARALRSFGETGGARTELERARALFKRMGAKALLAAIDRELVELTEGAGTPGPRV